MVTKVEAAQELLKRRNARRSLLSFICYINSEYIVSDFSIQVCAALEQFYQDVVAGNRPVLIIEAPPQHGKSEIVSRNLPAWLLGINPDLSIGGLSYGKDLAADMNRDIQRLMMGEEYKRLFPGSSLNYRRIVTIEVEPKRNSETFEVVGHKGRYIAQGVGGPITGKRLDIGIIDDPIKNAKEALSETIKSALWKWYISTFLTRLSRYNGHIVMATRWAVDDMSGRIIDLNKRAKLISFPAINENDEALIPELHPLDKLLEMKEMRTSYFWTALYQQRPTHIGGGVIKSSWFNYYEKLPLLKWRAIYVDTAQKTKTHNDYSVFQLWGYCEENNKIYLIDQIRGKWEAWDLENRAPAFYKKHKPYDSKRPCPIRHMAVEDKVSGTGLIQNIKRKGGIPIKEIPRSIDIVTRMLDGQGFIESGHVCIPDPSVDHLHTSSDWVNDFIIECEAFSLDMAHAHDDQVSTMLDAIDDMLQTSGATRLSAWV
jgi:predicted phage terminase large subunit-like protein